jgi:hypothetical protein
MGIEPKFVKREAQLYAGIREQMHRDDLPEIVPSTLSALFAFLQKQDIHATGAPLIRYFVVDYSTGAVEVDVGAPVGATAG